MQPLPIMIFAAGFGTRMGDLTASCPKPLIRVAGRALIDHALDIARGAGCGKIIINLHYLGHMIEQHLRGQDIVFSHEPEILETGGGLKAALPLLGDGPVLVLNSDAVWRGQNPLLQLLAAWDGAKMDALLLLTPPEAATGHSGAGDFLLAENGQIRRAKGSVAPIYLGAQILHPRAVAKHPETMFSLGKIWDHYIASGRAYGVMHRGAWCDVGSPAGIALAERMLDV